MRGRVYNVVFDNIGINSVQDLITVAFVGQQQCIMRLHRFWMMNVDNGLSLPAQQQLVLGVKRIQLGSLGSGGSVVVPVPMLPTDTASVATAHINDTTKASGFGITNQIWKGGCNIFQGLDVVLSEPPVAFPNAEGFIFELLSAPIAAAHFSGGMVFEEIG